MIVRFFDSLSWIAANGPVAAIDDTRIGMIKVSTALRCYVHIPFPGPNAPLGRRNVDPERAPAVSC